MGFGDGTVTIYIFKIENAISRAYLLASGLKLEQLEIDLEWNEIRSFEN